MAVLEGSFVAFCDHISFNLRIPYGRTLISSILELRGERTPRRRPGRSPDEKALRDAFETFFPGAQWEGDGTPIDVQIGQQRFGFNIELMVDAASAANVGISVRDEEDSKAVIEAFDDGVQTTGAPPLCTLLDNRPSNHSPQIDESLGATMRMHATKGRAQNKAHVEGAFGLFFQVMPLLAITAAAPREMARQLLQIVVTTWARTLNHRPRKDRKGRSRVAIYTAESPTSQQIEQARTALEERCKQQEKARETLRARQDPLVRDSLDNAFRKLALDDPQGNIRSAIARYPLDAIVNGIVPSRMAAAISVPNPENWILGTTAAAIHRPAAVIAMRTRNPAMSQPLQVAARPNATMAPPNESNPRNDTHPVEDCMDRANTDSQYVDDAGARRRARGGLRQWLGPLQEACVCFTPVASAWSRADAHAGLR